jgi:hypothetical protein
VKWFQFLGISSGLLFVFIVGYGFYLPAKFEMSQSTQLSISQAELFEILLDLESFQKWSPWAIRDPEISIEYPKGKKGKGAEYVWKGPKSGSGKITITEVFPPYRIETKQEFDGGGFSTSYWELKPKATETELIWGFSMDNENDLFGRYFSAFLIGKMLARDYQVGFTKLNELIKVQQEINKN